MASESHVKAARLSRYDGANSLGAAGPPPSTLAAQLVENVSASSRPSRPDETTELKRLSAVIERVKNDPGSLKTHEERVEHNHLLVYVCGGVFLESLKLDDAFADAERLRTEALKAINFLKVTINETPTVLKCTTDGKTFLSRGEEPLWLWILPKLLRMLGHRRCLAISAEIEGLCQYILLLATRNASLWDLGPSLMQYFQVNLSGKLSLPVYALPRANSLSYSCPF
jgi:serine/threonine-protein kinase ATR